MRLAFIRIFGFLILLFVAVGAILYFQHQPHPHQKPIPQKPQPTLHPSSKSINTPIVSSPTPHTFSKIKTEFMAHLQKSGPTNKTLSIPESPKTPSKPKLDKRAKGRKQRENYPLGVLLWDNVPVFKDQTGKTVLYTMQTGDFVRIFPDAPKNNLIKIQPGVDVYLAATSKQFEAAGNRFPDRPGWMKSSQIQIFNPNRALEFTQKTTPMTLGPDSSFSTLDFYERAMKNPDPVVHRVVGPRMIELLSIHEDYVSSWGALYRDHDSKIRSVTLASLRKRGVGHNREIIEDLIKRLAELTTARVHGEMEVEVLTILNILEESRHPRVPAALQGFAETWVDTQGDKIVSAIKPYLPKPPPKEKRKSKKKKKKK